jgi:hypothetical protein
MWLLHDRLLYLNLLLFSYFSSVLYDNEICKIESTMQIYSCWDDMHETDRKIYME